MEHSSIKKIVDEQIVEIALLQHPSVEDCVVLFPETATFPRELVAYVVYRGPFDPEQLKSHLQLVLPTDALPSAYVPVSTLPLTELGEVDKQALATLPVLDSDTVQRWQEMVQSIPEVEQVAVVVQEYSDIPPLPLHRADLLPDWKPQRLSILEKPVSVSVNPVSVRQEESERKAPSVSYGKPLPEENTLPKTLSLALQRTALEVPEKGIVYLQLDDSDSFQSYAALLEEAERIMAGLRNLDLKPQDKVIFQLEHHQDFITAFWGCILGGFVPVPISVAPSYSSVNSTINKLHNAWQRLEQPLIVTSSQLDSRVHSLSSLLELENWQVATIEELRLPKPDCNWHNSQPEDLAILIFTSGSTGIPKGVMLSHQNILSNVAASAQINSLTREDISLNWLQLDHVGSLIRCCIRDIYVGSQQIHAPVETFLENPLKWLDWIEQYQVTFAWAPNFALGLVNTKAQEIKQRQWDLSNLKSLLSVAEAIVPKTAKRFWELLAPYGLKANAMHSAWGMTETCAAVTFSHRYLLDLASDSQPFVEVGVPVPGFGMRIVDGKEQIVPEGTVGQLQICGPMITQGYYQNAALNCEAFTEDGWFKTGDFGFICQGRLTITGREKDIIIINGLNHYSYEIEAVVEEVEGVTVSYTAACAIRNSASATDQLVIFFHTPETDDNRLVELLKQIRGNIVRQVGVNPDYLIPVPQEAIPKTAVGKIQRSLLKQGFLEGEFEPILKRIDILSGNDNTLPDWFYRKIWRCKAIGTLLTQKHTGLSLVFLDQLGLGYKLCTQLRQLEVPCVSIEVGTEFLQLDANHYCIDPKNPNHYQQLLNSIKQANQPIEQILHLWTYGEYSGEVSSLEALEEAQHLGAYSLLFLIQALNQVQGSEHPIRLYVISNDSQPVQLEDKIAYEKAPIIGLIKTIPQEMPWLDCRHLDLSNESIDVLAAYVFQELLVIQNEREVAYRNGQRLVPRLEKVDWRKTQKQELPFKHGGMYLLSGGLGEIGVEIAKYLLQHYQARLLLVGRTPLPEKSMWSEHLKQGDTVSARIQSYLSLEQLGGEVIYENVDICDLSQLQQIVARTETRWQSSLDGVIHLARITQDQMLTEETQESLAAMLRPKVSGTWVLHQLLKDKPNGVFISFSSVVSFFGAFGVGAYAAANRFLEYFTDYQRYKGSLQSYCFAWSIWEEVGMSRSYQMRDLSRSRGYYTILSAHGLTSLLTGLSHHQGQLIVGLDGRNSYMRQYVETKSYCTQKLCAYFTSRTSQFPVGTLQGLEVRDRFGSQTYCDYQKLSEMPMTDTGKIESKKLSSMGRRTHSERVAPRNELEKKVATIWQEVLGVAEVGIYDNFFELGGSSLLAMRLFLKIEKTLGKALPLATLFQAPTVEQLAGLLSQEEQLTSWPSLVAIQPKGAKPPLFGIHEVNGNILFYRDLVHHLGLEQPFYGLQAQGLDGNQPPLTRIEDMATQYIREIRNLQPTGPYFLIGFSVGGVIAFEVAQQLYSQGQKVALLALIDTYATGDLKHLPVHQRVPRHLGNLLRLGPKYIFTEAKIRWFYHQVQEKLQKIAHMFYWFGKSPLPQIPRPLSVIEANRQAVRNYIPQVYPGRLIFLQATDLSGLGGWDFNPKAAWSQRTTEGLECYDIPGTHESMLKEPYVRVLAETLRNCIDTTLVRKI